MVSKVPQEAYSEDFRNEVEVPRSIVEASDRRPESIQWKEDVATEQSLDVRLSEGGEVSCNSGPLLVGRRPGNVRKGVASFPMVGDRLKADRWQSLCDGDLSRC